VGPRIFFRGKKVRVMGRGSGSITVRGVGGERGKDEKRGGTGNRMGNASGVFLYIL